ncbi:MAG: hypothetical protein QOH50_3593, partial [Kribbellaceae bacterium]|nr:hypothetical protein [Kribbellaceae bacterium]
ATVGADGRVVIHATGAELRALLNGDQSTGGELEGYGPIPQNSIRYALTHTLHPAQPTTPDSDSASYHEIVDEATIGADAHVVIHATGAELRALLNGDQSTGGELEGHGPIPQNSLRKALIKALTQALLPALPTTPTTPTNGRRGTRVNGSRIDIRVTDQPPASDPDKYTPSAALDRYVRLRDRTCRFPACNRPAEYTDIDHRQAFAAGGRTTADNLHCLCRHHHRLKHEGNWTVHPNPDGSQTWTSPTGRQYLDDNPDP